MIATAVAWRSWMEWHARTLLATGDAQSFQGTLQCQSVTLCGGIFWTFKKKVFWGVDNPLKANLFENMKAVACKYLLWNLTRIKVDQRSPATDSSPWTFFKKRRGKGGRGVFGVFVWGRRVG